MPLEKGIFSPAVLSCQHFVTAWLVWTKFHLCNPPHSAPWPCEGIWSCWGLHHVSPSALFDSPHSVCKQTSYEGDLCDDDPCCLRNQYSVWALVKVIQWHFRRRWRWLLWLLLLVMCLLLFHNFLSGRSVTPVSAAVQSHIRFSDSFIPDFFSSMQNWYTFSIIAPASSLYIHASLAILQSEVALHVHNTSKHAFFCKHVNREKKSCFFAKAKIKKMFYWGSNSQLCFQIP